MFICAFTENVMIYMHDSYFQLIVSLFPQLSTKKVFMFQKKLTSIQHFQKKKKKENYLLSMIPGETHFSNTFSCAWKLIWVN